MNASKTIPVVPKKLIIPFILLTSLFALWGFANAVTDPMVQAFKKVLELSMVVIFVWLFLRHYSCENIHIKLVF